MLSDTQIKSAIGATAYGSDGEKIGKIGQVYLDDQTDQPEFATIQTGLFGTKESFVPLAQARVDGDRVTVPFTKDQVKDAPNVDVNGGHLDRADERRLYTHYGMSYSEARSDSGLPDGTGLAGDVAGTGNGLPTTDTSDGDQRSGTTEGSGQQNGYDTSGPTTDDAMTRSEEHLTAGTREEQAGRARLRKYVVTEEETVTVPVRKERATLEREPITDANAGDALSGPEISEEEHEVVLTEERPVVETTAEPVERVRLGKETTTEEQTVSGEVRKEQIDVEGDVDQRR